MKIRLLLIALFLALTSFFAVLPLTNSASAAVTIKKPEFIVVVPILLQQKHQLTIHFFQLKNATKISYVLTYESDGVPQGVTGDITPGDESHIEKQILLGTCSGNDCMLHKVKKVKLVVTTTFDSGKITTKTYHP